MYRVLKYIHENIREPMSLTEVAEYFNCSKWHFSKKFHQATRMTFNDYARRYRIQLAAIEILQGKKAIEVAFAFGYDTVGGFNKAFLKMWKKYFRLQI